MGCPLLRWSIPIFSCESLLSLFNILTFLHFCFRSNIDDGDDDPMEGNNSERKVVVYERQLMNLFNVCQLCGMSWANGRISSRSGTLAIVTQYCMACDKETTWRSQPYIGKYPAGNISLSTAILCAGAMPGQTIRFLKFWGVSCMSRTTFHEHQKNFLHHAVKTIWDAEEQKCLENVKQKAEISGDARCDSMGHCAKYGSYSLHDTDQNKIVCTLLVQVLCIYQLIKCCLHIRRNDKAFHLQGFRLVLCSLIVYYTWLKSRRWFKNEHWILLNLKLKPQRQITDSDNHRWAISIYDFAWICNTGTSKYSKKNQDIAKHYIITHSQHFTYTRIMCLAIILIFLDILQL